MTTSPWGIIVPESAVNDIYNPSAELALNFAAHNSATVTRDTTQARHGDYSYKIVPGGTNRGVSLTTGALSNEAGYVSFYVYGTITGTLQVSQDAGGNYNAAAVIGGVTGSWVRYGVAIPQAQRNASVATIIRNTANETFYIDSVLSQNVGYATTYFDGDLNGYCKWTGLRHGSTSTRDSQDRSGGRLRTLDEFGFNVMVQDGHGLPAISQNLQALSLQPSAVYQGYKFLPRTLTLRLEARTAPTLAAMHTAIQDLINLIKPDLVAGAQPFTLFYAGANATTTRRVFASFVYDGGLEGGGQRSGTTFGLMAPVRLLAVDPYWYEDDRVTAALDFTDDVTSAYGLRRINGAWSALGSGFNAVVRAIVVDAERGRVYFGGNFTTANGVTVNRVTYWDGTTFVAMGATPGCAGGTVYSLALAANGDLWVGGAFTSAGGSTADGLARWNVAAATWTVFANGTAGDTIYALAIDASGNVYGGGLFTNWDGAAAEDRIWKYNGSAFSALGTGMDNTVLAIKVHPDGKVYVGGLFTTGNGVTLNGIGYWNGTTFVAMGSTAGVSGGTASIDAILVLRNGNLVIGGDFTSAGGAAGYNYVAGWNGSTFTLLGTGLNSVCFSVVESANGGVIVGGQFTTAGGLALTDCIALWNGYVWTALDLDFSGGPVMYALAESQGTIYIGNDTSGTATVAGRATVTNTGLNDCFPEVSIIGPSSATATFQWLENQTAGDVLYFNLTINTLEIISINFQSGNKSVSTIWNGRPGVKAVGFNSNRGNAPLITGYISTGLGGRFVGIIHGQPLAGSDFAAFHLQPGANVIATFATGTLTAMVVVMHFTPRHLSVDGAAA